LEVAPLFRFNGTRLRQVREASGLRREHVAVAIGRGSETVAAYEAGRIDPPASVVASLADALGCDVAEFFDRAEVVA
jgi:transcriptional regulator with XRE-family HTH domain